MFRVIVPKCSSMLTFINIHVPGLGLVVLHISQSKKLEVPSACMAIQWKDKSYEQVIHDLESAFAKVMY